MTHSGTPAKSGISSTAPAKKNSDTKNAWKNRIRQACLSRVRRQSLSGSSNRTIQPFRDGRGNDNDDWAQQQQQDEGTTYMDSRSLVEAELELHGVRVVSPPSDRKWNHHSQEEQSTTIMMMDCGETAATTSNYPDGLVLTEDEVIELMDEIEREWKQHQQRILEDEMDRIEKEEQALFDTIAEYEQWTDDDSNAVIVLCPLCREANLTTSQCSEMGDDIVCPNHMDGSCAFRLEARSGLDLTGLKERLAHAIATHAEICSHHDISFQVSNEVSSDDDYRLSLLWGTCAVCGTRSCVA